MFRQCRLEFDFQNFLSANYASHTGSCISHLEQDMPELYAPYNGMPKTYVSENTAIHQLWWSADQVNFEEIGRQLGMEVVTVSSICQEPGCIIPYHRDSFFQIKQRFPDRQELKVRANVHMQDYQLGHFIQYTLDNKHHTWIDWKTGDVLLWDSSITHLGANCGLTKKYTLQVSGFLL